MISIAPTPVLALSGVGKRYRTRWALEDIDISLDRGQVLGIVGPNGAGKTTLLKIVSGLVRPSRGTGSVLGQSLSSKRRIAPHVGVVLEHPPFVEHMSGLRNLQLLASIRNEIGRHEIEASISASGLDPSDNRPVKAYSQGMRQRLAFAQAVMERPPLLLLDEPTNGLDPHGIVQLRERIRAIAEAGTAVMLSSHLLHEVETVCDIVIMIDGGTVRRRFDTGMSDAAHVVRVVVERDSDIELVRECGVDIVAADGRELRIGISTTTPQIVRELVSAGVGIEEVGGVRGRLEDAYLDELAEGAA